jgi:hypothetical protein
MNPNKEEPEADDQMDGSDCSLTESDSNSSDSTSSSDSGDDNEATNETEMLDPGEYEAQFKTLEQAIYESPCNYQLYVDIIKLAKDNMDFTKLREFRQKMSDMFPLTESQSSNKSLTIDLC